MSNTIEYTLKVPVQLVTKEGNPVETIEKVTLRKLQGKEVRNALNGCKGGGAGDMQFALLSESCGEPISTLDRMESVDIFALLELSQSFVGGPSS